jgi:hypothetical protein
MRQHPGSYHPFDDLTHKASADTTREYIYMAFSSLLTQLYQ